MQAPLLSAQARQLIDLELDPGALVADWRHCDQIANYLARSVSHERKDSFLYANLLSTVLNELLEIAFFEHDGAGPIACSLVRDGELDRIELTIPVRAAQLEFYRASVAQAQSNRVSELYRELLLGSTPPHRAIGLLELVADYGARIWLRERDQPQDGVDLIVDLHLEDNQLLA